MHTPAALEGLRSLQVSYAVLLVRLLDGAVQWIVYPMSAVETCMRKICSSSDKRKPVMNV